MTRRQDVWESATCIAIVVSLALLSAELSFKLRFEKLDYMFQADLDTLRGHALITEFQNRVIGPLVLFTARSLAPASVDNSMLWHSTRVLEAVVSYVVLYFIVLRMTGGRLRAVVAVGLVSFAYLWTPMTSPYELSNDFFDIMFVASFVALACAERPVALGLLVVIASANRESAAFAGLIWLGVAGMRHGWRPQQWRKLLPGAVFMVLGAVTVAALRYGLSADFQPRQFIGLAWALAHWQRFFSPFGATPMFIAAALVFTVTLRGLPRPWTADQKGLLLAAAACAIPSGIFGIAYELRVWLPSCTILSVLAVIGANGQTDRQWLATLFRSKT